jgi:hypothetical protein
MHCELELIILTNDFRYNARCGAVFLIGCQPVSPTILPHRDWVNSDMHSEDSIESDCGPSSRTFGDTLEGCDAACFGMHLETAIVRTSKS